MTERHKCMTDNEQVNINKCVICDKKTTIGRFFNMVEGGRVWECKECATNQMKLGMI